MEELTEGINRAIKRWKRNKKVAVHPCCGPSEFQARGEGEGRWGYAARARYGKSQALHTVAETGMGRHGGVVCAARVVLGPPPGLWRVHHTHTAVFSHATDVTSLRTTRTQGTVKRRT